MTPFVNMYDIMQQKVKARAYADRITREREESPLSSSKSIFDMIDRLKQPSTTTPQPSLIERLLKPYIEPWQQQLDDFSKGIPAVTILTSSTALPKTTISHQENLVEKSFKVFLPSVEKQKQKTTLTPMTFNMNLIEQLFSPEKMTTTVHRKKRQILPLKLNLLNSTKELDSTHLVLSNPFTPNPLMSLFTTLQPLPELPSLERKKVLKNNIPIMKPNLPAPHFKLRDPFYNPFFPNRKSKLFELLAPVEAGSTL